MISSQFGALLIAGALAPPADVVAQSGPNPADPSANPAAADERPAPVSLEQLLAFAQTHAPALQIAERQRGYGTAARDSASAVFTKNPTLEFGIGPRFDSEGTAGFDFTLTLEQPVDIAGQRGRRLRAAELMQRRLDSQASLVRWELRRRVTLAYRLAAIARERAQVETSLVRFADDMLGIARRRFAAGELSAIDVRIAQNDLAQARQALIAAEQAARQARLALCESVGWPLAHPPAVDAPLEPPQALPQLSHLLSLAAVNHPELRVRRADIAEAHARSESADAEAWPSPAVGAYVAREGHRRALGAEGPNYIVMGTVGITLPFWQQNQAERGRARADEALAQTQAEAAAVTLRARIAQAHSQLSAALQRLQLFTGEITPALEDSLSLLRRGLEAGEIPLLNVAVARERFLQTQRDALEAYAEYYRALAGVELATGTDAAHWLARTPGGAP